MIDRLASAAPTTLHVAFKHPAVTAIRPMQPVVERPRHEGKVFSGDTDSTTYTPHMPNGDEHSMYSHKGAPASSPGVFSAASYTKSESLDLQVRTAEGDVVTLSFSDSNSATVITGAAQTANGSAQADIMSSWHSSDMQVSVKGQLSDQELAAIKALADQAGDVANDFFSGDMAAAVQDANQMEISGRANTLSAFSLNLQSIETQIATAPTSVPNILSVNVQPTPKPLANTTAQALTTQPTTTAAPAIGNDSKDLLKSLMALFDRITGGVKGLASGHLLPVASSIAPLAASADAQTVAIKTQA